MQLINIQSLEGFFFLGYIKISVAYMYVNLYQQQYSSRSYPYYILYVWLLMGL